MRLLLVVLLMIWAWPAVAQGTTPTQALDAAVNQMIRPAMANFKSRASGLESAMGALCAVPAKATVDIAEQQFRLAALAYGQIEFLRLGPLMEDNRADRLLFWPDRRGIGLRQVQAILAQEDVSATEVVGLRSKSVAVQGFGALEFVLFGTGAETLATPEGAFRCRYGAAIAANISLMADQLTRGWYQYDGVAVHLTRPQADYADYRTETEALEALVGTLAHGAEAVRDQRLLPFMARPGQAAQPKQALFWRSGLTAASVGANIEGLRQLFERSGVADIGEAGAGGIDQSIAIQFDRAFAALDKVTAPVDEAVADPEQAQALEEVVSATQMLQVVIGEQLAAALDLSVGFSSMDGD